MFHAPSQPKVVFHFSINLKKKIYGVVSFFSYLERYILLDPPLLPRRCGYFVSSDLDNDLTSRFYLFVVLLPFGPLYSVPGMILDAHQSHLFCSAKIVASL